MINEDNFISVTYEKLLNSGFSDLNLINKIESLSEQGNNNASFILGEYYIFLYTNSNKKDVDFLNKAIEVYKKIPGKENDVYLNFCLARCYWEKGLIDEKYGFKDAINHYEVVGENGNPVVQYWLGNAFLSHKYGVTDYVKAVYWYKKAVKQGVVLAAYNLALCYLFGMGTEQSDIEAYNCFLFSANHNHKESMSYLITMMKNSLGVEKNDKELAYWEDKLYELFGEQD